MKKKAKKNKKADYIKALNKLYKGPVERKQTTKQLADKAWKECSIYIRNKYMKRGKVRCYTCGKIMTFKEAQAGHYISRSHLSLKYAEENLRPQCCGCNIFKHGEPQIFGLRLAKEYGLQMLEHLDQQKRKVVQDSRAWHELHYKKYKKLNCSVKKGLEG